LIASHKSHESEKETNMAKGSTTTTARSGVAQQRATAPQFKARPGSGISKETPATDSGATNPRPMSDAQHAHFASLADNLIDNTLRAGHGGHMLGKQGPGNTGHDLPPSDAHLQGGAYLPQAMGRDGGVGFDDPSTKDYGTVDDKG
jgi:hypothetical protein